MHVLMSTSLSVVLIFCCHVSGNSFDFFFNHGCMSYLVTTVSVLSTVDGG